METRAALGAYDPGSGTYTLTAGTQGVHLVRNVLAKHVLKVPAQRVRVVTPDVGGAFGVKLWVYPEYALVLFAARRLGRPVKWVAERGEAMASDHQGRDLCSRATLALDADGRFLALAIQSVANLGAYASNYGPSVATVGGTRALIGPYRTPALHVRVRAAYTNTAPTDAYRGAGRPENVYLLERLIDKRRTNWDSIPPRFAAATSSPPTPRPTARRWGTPTIRATSPRSWTRRARRAAGARRAGAKPVRGRGRTCVASGSRSTSIPAAPTATMGGAALRRRGCCDAADRQPIDGARARDRLCSDRRRSSRHSRRPRARTAGDTDLVAHGSGSSGSRSLPTAASHPPRGERGGGEGPRRRRRAAGGAGGGRAFRGRALPHRRHR